MFQTRDQYNKHKGSREPLPLLCPAAQQPGGTSGVSPRRGCLLSGFCVTPSSLKGWEKMSLISSGKRWDTGGSGKFHNLPRAPELQSLYFQDTCSIFESPSD